ncbi:MAG TPA: Rap1a/Tai family immunity protein [Bordetella sp.]|nr:Rap1a/Tai family immunity protein [Bordetella sp.]
MIPPARRTGPPRLAVALAFTLVAGAAAAQQPAPYHPITAQDLYAGIMDGGLASWVEDPAQRTMLSTLMATSYILGIADTTNGKQWCPSSTLDMEEMPAPVLDYLAHLPEARRAEGAAGIVIEALARAHPCPK